MKTLERFCTTTSAQETRQLGKILGGKIKPGTVLLLSGDLGAGKTVFVQGLADGIGVPADCYVTSPTYTIINEYPARFPFFHVDLFRLEGESDLEEIGFIELFSPFNVVAIEWPERLHQSDLPIEYCKVEVTIKSEFIRNIRIIAYGLKMSDLIREVPFSEGQPI